MPYGDRQGGFRPRSGGNSGGYGGGGGFGGGGSGFAPVKVGEELDVKIEAVGEKGDGIARKRGFVLFVPNTKEGDEVKIRVTKVLRKVGFAEVIGASTGVPAAEQKEEAPQEEEAPAEEEPAQESVEDTENFGEEELDEPPAAPEDEEKQE